MIQLAAQGIEEIEALAELTPGGADGIVVAFPGHARRVPGLDDAAKFLTWGRRARGVAG